jgi:hypothetical protein
MTDAVEPEKSGKIKKIHWWRPAEALANSLAGAVEVAFRGCWHRHLGWPVAVHGYAYRVCLNCGAKRLFDENTFTAYGPYRYDLNELIASQKAPKSENPPMENLPHPIL